MSDKDSKDTQDKTENQEEYSKTRNGSDDDNVKSKQTQDNTDDRKDDKNEDSKKDEDSQTKTKTEGKDTQTDNTNKGGNRKDSQADSDSGGRNKDSKKSKQKSPREDKRSETAEESDGRSRQKEFFREELKRLEDSLKREKSKIVRPEVKKHTPYIFNTLEPYYNTATVRYLIDLPDEVEHQFISRRTAIGLCDPWVDHSMDTQFLPRLDTGSSRAINRHQEMEKRDQKIRERERRSKKEGSTMLPKFPVVTMESKDLATKQLYFSDVPMLRKELRSKYSQNADKKIDEDYQRTKQDFYRMDLDKMDEVHPINRPHMRNAYFAYLQNNPGSRKAVHECVKGMKKEGKAH